MPRKVDKTTVKNKNRRMHQEALRDRLRSGRHLDHASDLLTKVRNDIGLSEPKYDQLDLQKIKLVVDGSLKIANKYLGDQKEEIFTDMTDVDREIGEMSDQELEELAKQEK